METISTRETNNIYTMYVIQQRIHENRSKLGGINKTIKIMDRVLNEAFENRDKNILYNL